MFLQKIDRYIFKNIIHLAVFYTLVPTLILWIVQSRKIFEFALGGVTSVWMILKLSLYLIPPVLPYIIPFAVLLAVITLLVRLYNDSELTILWASGLSPARLMRSFLIFAIVSAVIVAVINLFLAPQISRQLKIELFNVKNDIIRSALKPGIIQTPQDNLTIYIDNINGNSYIEGFYLQQKSDDNHIRIFTAEKALLTDNNGNFQLLLLKGRILNWKHTALQNTQKTTQDISGNTNKIETDTYPTILEFDKFTMNISDIMTTFNNSQDLQLKAQDYSISDLLTAKYAKTPQEIKKFIAIGHEQIIASFFPIIFVLFTIVMMLRPIPPRGFPYRLILQTITFSVLFRILSAAIQGLSNDNLDYIYVSYGVHGITMLLLALLMIPKKQVMQ
jgi:lipopolysaccharide export LptBFGC system permease protein LptF